MPHSLSPWQNRLLFVAVVVISALLMLTLPPAQGRLIFLLVIVTCGMMLFALRGVALIPEALNALRTGAGTAAQIAEQARQAWMPTLRLVVPVMLFGSMFALVPTRDDPYKGAASLPLTALQIAFLLLLMLVGWVGSPLRPPLITAQTLTPVRLRLGHAVLLLTGLVVLVLLAEVNGRRLVTSADSLPYLVYEQINMREQFILLLLAVALIVAGLGGVRFSLPARFSWAGIRAGLVANRGRILEWGFVLLLTLVGIGWRFYRLDDTIRLFVDEVNFSNAVLRYLTWDDFDNELLWRIDGINPYTWVFPFWQGEITLLLGRNFFGLRGASAIVGGLTLPALYLLARTLFDRPTALIATLLLLTFPAHYHFSRLALNQIADGLFGTLAVAFLARALRHKRRLDYALAGVMLGFTQYFFEGGRLFFIPLAGVWLGLGFVFWRSYLSWQGIGIMALAAFLLAAPVYYTWESFDGSLTGRMDASGLSRDYWITQVEEGNFAEIADRLRNPYLFYLMNPDGSVYYFGTQGLIVWFAVPFFLVGVALLLWRWRDPSFVLIVWVVATAFGNSLLIVNNNAVRYLGVFPALVLITALGIRHAPRLWGFSPAESAPDTPRRVLSRRLATGFMAVTTLILCAAQAQHYYTDHLPNFNQRARPTLDYTDAALRSVDFPHDTQIYLVTNHADTFYARYVLNFFRYGLHIEVVPEANFTEEFVRRLNPRRTYAFFFEQNETTLPALVQTYMTPQPPRYTDNDDIPAGHAMVLYFVPAR